MPRLPHLAEARPVQRQVVRLSLDPQLGLKSCEPCALVPNVEHSLLALVAGRDA